MHVWRRYWFAHGGRFSVAILRIAIALSVWIVISKLQGSWPANAPGAPNPPDVYRPIGIWMLLGDHPPPAWAISALWIVAKVSTVFMLVGAASRASTVVSFVTTVSLASLYYSGFPGWSHGYNVVLLAHLALVGGRTGDALSLDSVIRRLRHVPAASEPFGYMWTVRLVQLAVAVMFASGMFHKVMQGGFTLSWAFSDNLRHQLLVRFDLADQARPLLADWIIDDVVRYRAAAALNLISQIVPLGACIFVRRPIVRLICGSFFVVETIALGLVMDLWNLHWLPLAVVFVDWDRLVERARGAGAVVEAAPEPRPRLLRQGFVAIFVMYELVTAFVPHVDQRLNTYPFSSFPMFASIRARKPFHEHQPYTVAAGEFEIVSTGPVSAEAARWVNYSYRKTFSTKRCDELRTRMVSIIDDARYWAPEIVGLRYHYTLYEAPAYPEPARLVPHRIATIGELQADGAFRCALGRVTGDANEIVVTPGLVVGSASALETYNERTGGHRVTDGAGPWRVPRARGVHAYVAVTKSASGEQRWLIANTAVR